MTTDLTCGTVTVRLIRSFEHRNIAHIVFHNVEFSQKAKDFMDYVDNDLKTRAGIPPPFRKFKFDTMKISHQAHGAKTSDRAINVENDEELILSPDKTLQEAGIKNETEISYFRLDDYQIYKDNPVLAW